MGERAEVLPWERQPREGAEAYAAFLAYRDLGWRRTHEATRVQLGKRPGYLKPIERWSALREWRLRAKAWDAHLQAERDKIATEEAEKWERRRLQALEDGWRTCRALRARLEQMLAMPPEMPTVALPEPAPEMREALPEAVATPEEAHKMAGRGPSRWNDLAVARLSKLIVELEWTILAEAMPPPMEIDPLTATDEQIQAYLVLNPRFGRPPPH